MKLEQIFEDNFAWNIYTDTGDVCQDMLRRGIDPTELHLIPDLEGVYYVRATQVFADTTRDCFLQIVTPERIAESVVKLNAEGYAVIESIHDQPCSVIPIVGSACFGNYELYYAKENPQIGIDILKKVLCETPNNVVAEDLGYILRDENRIEEAIKAFLVSEKLGPSSEYIFLELSNLYKVLCDRDKELFYLNKFEQGH